MAAIAGIAGGAIYYYNTLNEKTDENLVAAQKYMEHGQFDNALNAFQQALSEAKDSATIQLQIDHLKSYKQASDFLEDKDYSSAITTLNDLKGRLTDSTSPLAEAVDELLTTVQSERAKSIKTPDTSNKPNSTDDKPDDTSTNDPDDTDSDNDNDDTSSNANHTTDPTPNDNDSKPDEDQQATSQQEELRGEEQWKEHEKLQISLKTAPIRTEVTRELPPTAESLFRTWTTCNLKKHTVNFHRVVFYFVHKN